MGTVTSMDKSGTNINPGGRWAPLSNVALCARALERALNREPNLPGLVALTAPSGYGKSMAASYCANKFAGFYVECRSYFTRKTLAQAILREMDIKPGRTLGDMMEQIAEQLDLSQRPLILDECDHLIDKGNTIEIVRDIHEMARTSILLIGEEQFPKKAAKFERFHNRVLVWQLAQAATPHDARALAEFYCAGIKVEEDLLDRICHVSRHVPRRICVNLDAVRDYCDKNGLKKISLADWGKRDIYSGDAPARRSV